MTSVLCHIGLAKCASTTLQTSWANSSNYVGYFSHDLVTTVRDSVTKNQSDLPQFKRLLAQNGMSASAFSASNAQYLVISNESMTDSGVTTASDLQFARDVQDCIAISLEACVDKLLILVRDPLSWIRSRYYQQIKQGFAYEFGDFIANNGSNILENLDLEGIFSRFGRLDASPVVLPLELLQKDENKFWREYEGRLEFPVPDWVTPRSDPIATNVTLANTMEIHRNLNAVIERLETSFSRGKSRDSAAIMDALQKTRTWGTRRALTFASPEDLAFLERALGVTKENSPQIYRFDDAFVTEIKKKFLGPLSDSAIFPYPDILASYVMSVSEGSIEIF